MIVIIFIIISTIINSLIIDYYTKKYIQHTSKRSNPHTIWLIFWTSKTNNLWTRNIFFMDRIRRAVELFQEGKISYILVSGDNSKQWYDETTDMYNFLVERGIPSYHIILDYAGLSTRDSIARAKLIFQVPDLLLISQEFQVQRWLIACLYFNINCDGSATNTIPFHIAPRVYLREYGARIKLWYDMITPNPSIGWTQEDVPWL